MPDPIQQPAELVRVARQALARAARGLAAYHANACVKCGLCGDSCHIYRAEPQPENLPAAKAGEVIRFYRRYHTLLGKLVPGFVGARDLTPESLDQLVEAVYGRCTACGRCGLHCSIGLDVASVIRAGRQMLAAVGKVPDGLQRTVHNQLETGNQMSIPREELISTAEWLSEDLQLETGRQDAVIPVDQPGRRILYLINPREVKFFPLSLSAAAGVFTAAGESWTLSSKFYDVTNYGLFSGDNASAAELTRRVIEEAEVLGVQEIILGECGHGFRSFRWEGPNWMQHEYPLPMRSILELLDEYLGTSVRTAHASGGPNSVRTAYASGGPSDIRTPHASGGPGSYVSSTPPRIRVDPSKNPDRVTLHDPCNLVRWGGVIEPQRRVLHKCCADFVEMTPNRLNNYCCGGGGGMLSMSEYGERRVASGQLKADQIRATGAKIVASPCHNCADQLLEINKRYKLGVEIKAVVELVYNALVWE